MAAPRDTISRSAKRYGREYVCAHAAALARVHGWPVHPSCMAELVAGTADDERILAVYHSAAADPRAAWHRLRQQQKATAAAAPAIRRVVQLYRGYLERMGRPIRWGHLVEVIGEDWVDLGLSPEAHVALECMARVGSAVDVDSPPDVVRAAQRAALGALVALALAEEQPCTDLRAIVTNYICKHL
jgi:hypothetical protein